MEPMKFIYPLDNKLDGNNGVATNAAATEQPTPDKRTLTLP
jgi:hypothetical protein